MMMQDVLDFDNSSKIQVHQVSQYLAIEYFTLHNNKVNIMLWDQLTSSLLFFVYKTLVYAAVINISLKEISIAHMKQNNNKHNNIAAQTLESCPSIHYQGCA